MKTKKQFALLDVCYPDYFTGYHRSVIGVNCDPVMTNKDMADQLKLELNYIETDFSKTEYLIAEEFISDLLEDPETIFVEDLDTDPDNVPDFYELYAYFSIIKPVYKYGIMFLS